MDSSAKNMLEHNAYPAQLLMVKDGRENRANESTISEWLDELLRAAQRNLGEESLFIEAYSALYSRNSLLRGLDEPPSPVKTDKPLIGILARYNDDFNELSIDLSYHEAVLQAGGLPFVLPSIESASLLDKVVESFDGFILPDGYKRDLARSGKERPSASRYYCPKRDRIELALVQRAARLDRPLLGVSRGAQIIDIALGSNSCQDTPSCVMDSSAASSRYIRGVSWHPEHVWESDPDQFNVFVSFVDAAKKRHALRTEMCATLASRQLLQ